ncbi:hypothetical protein Poli38472_006022 [Pythium oligandrum]|uniref:Uncharacterized protein n=1 Tax=Pythium oligandrum TaxID=41045 RepID=A0A8K1CSR5_PYTOL|nr:hypothetical protein Poli38472_006022 [Pythium oligandrum]|eukprot:TMW68554.1 hypothetical protein Poli38472_006022 [Pythium oligandrum]
MKRRLEGDGYEAAEATTRDSTAVSKSAANSSKRFGSVAFGSEEDKVNSFLHQKLGKEHLSRRAGPRGTRLTYIESCKAIELANQAFGFNGWSCRIIECKEEYREKKGERWGIGFSSLVRIELKDGTSHEDYGFGQADGQPHLGAAIEQAKKASISDARKRALRLFGEFLGNSCYDREHIKDVHSNKPPVPTARAPIPAIAPGVVLPGANTSAPAAVANPPSNTAAQATATFTPMQQRPPPQPVSHMSNTVPQAPAATAQQQATSAAMVANRIAAIHAAEVNRQSNSRPNPTSMGHPVAPQGNPVVSNQPPSQAPASHTPAQPPVRAPQVPPAAPVRTSMPMQQVPAGGDENHPPPSRSYVPQNGPPPRPFMPHNAPPPSRRNDFTPVKAEPPRSLVSSYDMNDLSLSQFDFDPEDGRGGPLGAIKRMRHG